MTIFVISYDLKKTKNYPKLWDILKTKNAHKILESVYLLNVTNTASQVRDWLKGYVDDDDLLIVAPTTEIKFIRARAGTNEWIAANMN